jgi:MATE family multidrug resistance protein
MARDGQVGLTCARSGVVSVMTVSVRESEATAESGPEKASQSNHNPQFLGWESHATRELVRLAWPITVSTISYSVMTLVDTLLIGRVGAAELAGVGLGGTAAFVFLCFSFGLLRGAKTLVAQAIGAGRRDQASAYLGAAVAWALLIGALTVLFGELAASFVGRIAEDPHAARAASTYLGIRILGAPMALVYVALREVRYGQSDARTPMVATVLANLTNIVLAYLFIFVFGWGVRGAGIATVIAHSVEAGTLLVVQTRQGWHIRNTRLAHLRAVWRIGMPTGVQFTLEVGAFAMMTGLLAHLGVLQAAGHQIALQVNHFAFLPGFAIAEAASVLAGQAVGAGRYELVKRVARRALTATTVYTGACSVVFALGASTIVAGFTKDEALARVAVHLLWIAAVFQMFDGANVVARGVLRGAGDVRVPAIVGVLSSWVATPPLTLLLGYGLGQGALGGWLGITVEIFLASAILWWRLEHGQWHAAATASHAQMVAAAAALDAEIGHGAELAEHGGSAVSDRLWQTPATRAVSAAPAIVDGPADL